MLDDIGKIDRVLKPEPLKTHRDRGGNSGNTRNEHPPAEAEQTEKEDEVEEAGPTRLLDVRI